jgi:hypothetical protein
MVVLSEEVIGGLAKVLYVHAKFDIRKKDGKRKGDKFLEKNSGKRGE